MRERKSGPLLLRFADALGENADGIRPHLVDAVTRLAVGIAQVAAHQDAWQAVVAQLAVAMVVSSDEETDIVGAHGVGHVVPVVHVALQHGVVCDEDDGCVLACLLHFIGHPANVLRHYMSVGHAHQRSRVEAKEEKALVHELEAFATVNVGEGRTARFAPLRLVVAQDDVVGRFQQIEARLDALHAEAISIVGQVTRYQHKVDAVRGVDLGDGAQQVFGRVGVPGCEVDVRNLCEAEESVLGLHRQRGEAGKQ